MTEIGIFLKYIFSTYCVRRVNAALVTDAGRLSPLMISRHIFLFITWKKKRPRIPFKKGREKRKKVLQINLTTYLYKTSFFNDQLEQFE